MRNVQSPDDWRHLLPRFDLDAQGVTVENFDRYRRLFLASARTLAARCSTVERSRDWPGLGRVREYRVALVAKKDFAPAILLTADEYLYIAKRWDESYLAPAEEMYQRAMRHGRVSVRQAGQTGLEKVRALAADCAAYGRVPDPPPADPANPSKPILP